MSTEAFEVNVELHKQDLIEFIDNEPLDMLDEFTAEEIADCVISIAQRLLIRGFCNGHLIKKGNKKLDYLYCINNSYKGSVSVSNEEVTGVSRTEFKPFYNDEEDGYFTGLCSLAQMINEAWYACKN